jgi:hypothetical protein
MRTTWRIWLRGALLLPCVAAASTAHGWEYTEAMNAYGDSATAIRQVASNNPDVVLAVGCQGDRFRLVSIGPRLGSDLKLDPEPMVRVSLKAELGAAERWTIHKRDSGTITYLAASPTPLVRSMVQADAKGSDAVLRAEVKTSKGKPLLLEFPLTGLKAAMRKDLWEPCKLGNYIPESEF